MRTLFVDDKPRIYVAGPYRAKTDEEVYLNIKRAENLGLVVFEMGAVPVIPHSMYCGCPDLPDDLVIGAGLSLLHACQAMVVDLPIEAVRSSAGTMGEIEDCLISRRPYFCDDVSADNNLERLGSWIKEWTAFNRKIFTACSSLYGKFSLPEGR